jgi:hypothetical protein
MGAEFVISWATCMQFVDNKEEMIEKDNKEEITK